MQRGHCWLFYTKGAKIQNTRDPILSTSSDEEKGNYKVLIKEISHSIFRFSRYRALLLPSISQYPNLIDVLTSGLQGMASMYLTIFAT
jgi:hypothetical protein